MDRSTRSSKHKLFELVPEITKLERSNRKAVRKNLFGEEMSSGGNNIPGGNGTGNKNSTTETKQPTPTKPGGGPGRRKKLPMNIQAQLNDKIARSATEWRKEIEILLEKEGHVLEEESDEEDPFTGNGGGEDRVSVHDGSDKEKSDRDDRTRRTERGSSGRRPRRDDWNYDEGSEHPDGDGYTNWVKPAENWKTYDPSRPVSDYMKPNVKNIRSPIVVKLPPGIKSFELKSDVFRLLHNNAMFSGEPTEDLADHINTFVQLCGILRINKNPEELIQLKLFIQHVV